MIYCYRYLSLAFSLWPAFSVGHFMVGRVHSGPFDLGHLDGRYRPAEAAQVCEEHPVCAGFTYRGLMPGENSDDDMEYFCGFAQYISQVDNRYQREA